MPALPASPAAAFKRRFLNVYRHAKRGVRRKKYTKAKKSQQVRPTGKHH
jgi:hypothetical protein